MVFQNDGNYAPQGQGGFSGGRGFTPRPMVDVSSMGLKCANCNTDIKELPFQPSTDRPVYCRDCNRQRRQNFGGSRNRY
ncbi:MAG: hypothetical protein UX68_C0032G0043 [Parcubacteria group bacterium GW2011_GWA2_46_9]|nr:MAG: hypothetical protein UX68_C0032G0043 [Parcubacteria group bacterium GW2011_GWA2_46_9]